MDVRLLLSVALALALATAGCFGGGDDDGDDGNGDNGDDGNGATPTVPVQLEIRAIGMYPLTAGPLAFGYDQGTLSVANGTDVQLTFHNDDLNPAITHDWFLQALGVATAVVPPGGDDTIAFTVDLEPGEYAFWCTIGNHRDLGMEGTFVVT